MLRPGGYFIGTVPNACAIMFVQYNIESILILKNLQMCKRKLKKKIENYSLYYLLKHKYCFKHCNFMILDNICVGQMGTIQIKYVQFQR